MKIVTIMRMKGVAIGIVLAILAAASTIWYFNDHAHPAMTVSYTNPVYDHDAPDPTVIKGKDGYYYAVTTQSQYDGNLIPLPILRSADLVHWEEKGAVYTADQVPSWATPNYMWAPHITYHNGKYYVYYATKVNDGDPLKGMGIGVAVADHPLGPYKDKGSPIVWGTGFEKIDPFVLEDESGKRYLYWGSDRQPIYVQQLSDDGMSVIGDEKAVIEPGAQSRDAYDNLVEGPWVIKRNGTYYLFYSGDNCCQDSKGHLPHYAVMVARSSSPVGPFEPYPDNPILEKNDEFSAPGHNAVIQDDARQDWILYHAFDQKNFSSSGRVLMIDKIKWKDGWPVVNDGKGPTSTLQTDGPIVKKK